MAEEHDTRLIRATKKSDFNAIEWLLTMPGIDVNKTGRGGATALHWAITNAYNSDKDILQLFLASDKVLLDIGDENGDTPLMLAGLWDMDPELFPLFNSAVSKTKSNANRASAPLEVLAEDALFSHVTALTETTSSQPLAISLIQEDTVIGAGFGVLAVNAIEAVKAGTLSLVDKQWGGHGSSQTKIRQGLPNRRARFSPYAKQQKQYRNQKVGSYEVVEPGQEGSWCEDQTKYSCLDGIVNSRLPILKENGDDDLAAITKEWGINSELAKKLDSMQELDKNSLAQ